MSAVDFKEGDRVQYKIDLEKESVSEGIVQKVLKGGESLRKEQESLVHSESTPRYVE